EQWLESVIQAVDGKLPGLPADSGAAAEEQDSRLDEAASLIEQGRTQEAIAAYDAILADPNTDPELAATARAARANAILAERARDPAAGERALEQVEADPATSTPRQPPLSCSPCAARRPRASKFSSMRCVTPRARRRTAQNSSCFSSSSSTTQPTRRSSRPARTWPTPCSRTAFV